MLIFNSKQTNLQEASQPALNIIKVFLSSLPVSCIKQILLGDTPRALVIPFLVPIPSVLGGNQP